MASITEVNNALAQPILLAGQVLGSLYETVVPNVEASLQTVNTLLEKISAQLSDSDAALGTIVNDNGPDAGKKRIAYCKVVLKVEDPHTLRREYSSLLAELHAHQQQWVDTKSEPAYGRIGATRPLAEEIEQLHKRCMKLNQEVTEISSRLKRVEAS